MRLNPEKVRADIPLFQQEHPAVYMDSACMSLRPRPVIEAVRQYYEEFPACAGRSVHSLSQRVDEAVYNARRAVQKFINAKHDREVIFLRNTTEGLNLVARSFPFHKGDVVLTGDKEHNSNLLPWQLLVKRKGVKHDIIPSNPDNTFSMENFKKLLEKYDGHVRLVALGHTSNLDGVTIPARDVVKLAHKHGAEVVLDAAQSAPHKELDVRSLGVDAVAFSGHKMMGPSGIGVLYGKEEFLNKLSHDTVGGETVYDSTYQSAEWEGLPHKFEAGLQHYAGIIGLGAAVQYLSRLDLGRIQKHEVLLNRVMTDGLGGEEWFSLLGPRDPSLRGGILSFMVDGVSPHDIAGVLNAAHRVMIRSGAHCVHSWFHSRGVSGSARASLYAYNTEDEALFFVDAVKSAVKTLRP